MNNPEPSWQRQLLVGTAVLLVVAGIVGAVLAGIVVKGASYLGLGGRRSSGHLVIPNDVTSTPRQTKQGSQAPPPPPPGKTTHHHHSHGCTLTASPSQVAAMQKVTLTGNCPAADGGTLQVQRRLGDGTWSDFPITVQVVGGSYSTYIETSMAGLNHFRMLDTANGTKSNVSSVTIG